MPAELNFDANQVEPSTPFEPVPANTYRAHITESEVKRTKKGKGFYLQLTWEILEGAFKGRKFWDRLNIVNEKKEAQDIAQRALSAICHAAGVLRVSNSGQLHHIPVMVKVSVEKSDNYEPSNVVKGYKPCSDNPAAVPQPPHGSTLHGNAVAGAVAPAQPEAQAPASIIPQQEAANTPPWARAKAS